MGGYILELPDRENLDKAAVMVMVPPSRRRAGLGRALLKHAAARAIDLGRPTLTSFTRDGTPADGFAKSLGATVDWPRSSARSTWATFRPGGWRSCVRLPRPPRKGTPWCTGRGRPPEAELEQVARLNEAMGDAPRGADEERQHWDAARVRAVGQRSVAQGLRHYSVAARHEATGELAGLTEFSVDAADPEWGHQELTVVTQAHRGHRLGLLIKVAMLEWLAQREPQLKTVITGNAASNRHMVAINDALVRSCSASGRSGPGRRCWRA